MTSLCDTLLKTLIRLFSKLLGNYPHDILYDVDWPSCIVEFCEMCSNFSFELCLNGWHFAIALSLQYSAARVCILGH
jgi:hypothetical protein